MNTHTKKLSSRKYHCINPYYASALCANVKHKDKKIKHFIEDKPNISSSGPEGKNISKYSQQYCTSYEDKAMYTNSQVSIKLK